MLQRNSSQGTKLVTIKESEAATEGVEFLPLNGMWTVQDKTSRSSKRYPFEVRYGNCGHTKQLLLCMNKRYYVLLMAVYTKKVCVLCVCCCCVALQVHFMVLCANILILISPPWVIIMDILDNY